MSTYDPAALRALIAANPDATDDAVAQLAADDPRTARPIPLDELRALLTGGNVLGNLRLAALSGNAQAATADAYLNSSNKTIRSDLPDYAAQLDGMLTSLTTIGLTDETKAAVIALGGGYLLRGAAAADVTAERLIARCLAWEQAAKDAAAQPIAAASAAYVTAVETWQQSGGAGDPPAFTLDQPQQQSQQ